MVNSTPVIDPGALFSVQGTVALITGGGTGEAETPVRVVKKIPTHNFNRHRIYDCKGARCKWCEESVHCWSTS